MYRAFFRFYWCVGNRNEPLLAYPEYRAEAARDRTLHKSQVYEAAFVDRHEVLR